MTAFILTLVAGAFAIGAFWANEQERNGDK